MLHKLAELGDLLIQLPVSALSVTETWLDTETISTINIIGYHFVHKSPAAGRGGDVGLLIREKIPYHTLDLTVHNFTPKTFEGLFIHASLKKGTCLLGTIYKII